MTDARRWTYPLSFVTAALAVYCAAVVVSARLPFVARPGAVAIGLTLDLVVLVPLAFYLLCVRGRGWPVLSVVPVVVLGVVVAGQVLPSEHRAPVRAAELLVVPLELGLLGTIAWRATRAVRRARSLPDAGDPLERIRVAALDLVRHPRVAEVLVTEIAVLYYGLCAWRARAHAPAGHAALTQHRLSAHGAIVAAFAMLIAVEGLAVHFLVALWSPFAAWCLTLLSAYGVLWLVADWRATVLRPILVYEDTVRFRAGLRWELDVPRDAIAGTRDSKPDLGKEALSLTLLATPTVWVVLAGPRVARGLYGFRRRVRAIGIAPDDLARLRRLLR